jgi:hypothetical protein
MSDIRAVSYQGGAAVTQSDSAADPNGPFAALSATGAGNAKVTCVDGSTITIAIAVGIPFPIEVTRVWSTGTAATGIVGLIAVAKVL